jgi:hypothetical protein
VTKVFRKQSNQTNPKGIRHGTLVMRVSSKLTLLVERPACRLQDRAFDLVEQPIGIDRVTEAAASNCRAAVLSDRRCASDYLLRM